MENVPTEPVLPILSITSLSGSQLLLWLWIGLCVVFVLHWIIASYHWYTYGSNRSLSILSMIIYGVGGFILLSTMGTLLLLL